MSGKSKRLPVYYWDSCVFIAWLSNDPAHADHMAGIRQIAGEVDKGKVNLVTSTITRIEILSNKMPAEAAQQFKDFLKRENVKEEPVHQKIGELAAEIRNESSAKWNMKTISVPDAIHMATAFRSSANALHTLEEPLRELDGKIFGRGNYRAKICLPRLPQGTLF